MSKKILFLFILIPMVFMGRLNGQDGVRQNGGVITGQIIDAIQQTPVEYANIILLDPETGKQITGTITNREGRFQIDYVRPGRYDVEVRFMGFEVKKMENVLLAVSGSPVDLGTIPLQQKILMLQGVGVEGEKPVMTYEIDKKVINVSQMQTAISGSAVEVLENVPSVTVDIEGNVSLRGSSNFQLLIDGRPTVLDATEALQQIPASTIENIEIITNPSAKYDPAGAAGIINIIMKKNQRSGRSGLVNVNAGLKDKYGGNILLENKTERIGVVLGLDYNHFMFDGTRLSRNITLQDGKTSYIYSNGDSRRGRISSGLRGGLEFSLTPNDLFNFDTRIGKGKFGGDSEQSYDEWSDLDPQHFLYTSKEDRKHTESEYSANLTYLRRFNQAGHEITSQIYYSYENGDESTTDELLDAGGLKVSGRRASEGGPSTEIRTKIDYSLPLGEDKFESGYQSDFDRAKENTDLNEYDTGSLSYIPRPDYTHKTLHECDIHSLYSLYSGKLGPFGYQGGLRGEYTYRSIELLGEDRLFKLDRWDYFPTAHLSYQFPNSQKQLMTSYTRRIKRPHGWELEPFYTWMDAYNVRIGNPALLPEYIDSYEMGFQTNVGKNMFSAELYYRVNHNKVERIQSVYAENIRLQTTENVGTDYALGSEFMLNVDALNWWNVNLMGNLYNYKIEGILYEEPFSRSSFNWTSRLNNVFKLGRSTQIQVNGRYNGPTVSSQGRREGFFTTDFAVKQEFFEKTLSLTLQVRDIFKTAKQEFSSEGPNFYSYGRFTRESPQIMLNVKFNINRYKQDRQQNGGQENDGEENNEEF